jgi:hypothetical protein
LQDCLLEVALLFGGPLQSGVFLNSELICNQFLLLESTDLGIFSLLQLPNVQSAKAEAVLTGLKKLF